MANLVEIMLTSDSNNTLSTCNIWHPHSATNLMTYKGGGLAESHTISFIGRDYLAAIEKSKPVLHIWPLNSQEPIQGMRFILPGKSSSFAVTSDGSYCVAGIEEKIYLWQLSSGSLLTIINRHFQKINLLKFTNDGRFFASAADDGMVMVWSLVTVSTNPEVELVTQTTAGQHDPVYIFSDHSLPVTGLCLSKTGMHGRLFTVSSDRSCKIYDLTNGEMILSLVFDEPLSSIALDMLELNVFVGSTEGKIFQYSLTNPPRNKDVLVNSEENRNIFVAHSKAVTCLSVSIGGTYLLSGSNDEHVILWEIRSKQPFKTIKHKGPITNAFFSYNYEAIYKQDFTPSVMLHSLERTLEKNNDDITEIDVLVNKKINFWPKHKTSIDIDEAYTKELEFECKQNEVKLKNELEKMKLINSNLYAVSIGNILRSPTPPEVEIVNQNANINVTNKTNSLSKKKKKNKKSHSK